ncbi:prephenate dehydrogenase [Echinicola jeungdonensis]|uniref:Prephenate dehydrogenase n=1 Tax=Echinicola jeungdonensis TaxID=709343 RepID=A0ABV5J2J5_9BACT|nr:prephenate dehydrogenase [Echinicola jeungdonensis]MDN3668290.1 prephenate dehydrogenase [Echinicola jeungdonensis]
MKKVHIIGLGLLGGSFALALKKAFPGIRITGTDHNQQHQEEAVQIGLIEEIKDVAAPDTDLILIATPVHTIPDLLRSVLGKIDKNTLVMDFGSTKAQICQSIADHPNRENYLAAHPIAGTEFSGPKAAIDHLFSGKILILCELEKTNLELKGKAYEIFEALGVKLRFMGPMEHDNQLAYVSHLSHISSFMLGKTVLDKMEDDKNILNMAGSGFSSTVRLAKSSPAMWTPIIKENKSNILEALNQYINNLMEFRDEIVQDDYKKLFKKMEEINRIGNLLNLEK